MGPRTPVCRGRGLGQQLAGSQPFINLVTPSTMISSQGLDRITTIVFWEPENFFRSLRKNKNKLWCPLPWSTLIGFIPNQHKYDPTLQPLACLSAVRIYFLGSRLSELSQDFWSPEEEFLLTRRVDKKGPGHALPKV